jgi:hypothetical protein
VADLHANGTLAYSFVDSLIAMHPYYIARAIGGLLFLIGAVVGCYNIWMTIRDAPPLPDRRRRRDPGRPPAALQPGSEAHVRTPLRLERKAIGFALAIIGVASIGGWSRSRRCSPSTRPSRTRPTCASTRRSSWPAATSTSARAATPAIRR